MVASTHARTEEYTAGAPQDQTHDHHADLPGRGGLRRLIASTVRLADLQLNIWLTQAKIFASKMLMAALFYAGAAVVGVLAVIFLYIGLFKVLTDLAHIPAVWVYLIFGVVHLGLAVGLIFMAKGVLNQDTSGDAKREAHEEVKQERGQA